jgi:hypothetical protein
MKYLVLAVILLIAACAPTQTYNPLPNPWSTTSAPTANPIVSSTSQETVTLTTLNIPRVTVHTDQREYRQGSVVTIVVRNETEYPIWYSSGQRFWDLERLDSSSRWIKVDFSFPVLDPRTGTEKCVYIVYERSEPTKLEAGEVIQTEWYLGNICEWPSKPIGIPVSVPRPIAAGTYRIVFFYGLDVDQIDQRAYSESINIY